MPRLHLALLPCLAVAACAETPHEPHVVPGTPTLEDRYATGPMITAAADVTGGAVESCAVVAEERCEDGELQRCAIWDAATGDFAVDPPLELERALVLDRYADLHHIVDASAVNFETVDEIPPGTPEEQWADPAQFTEWDDHGDAAYYMGYFTYAAAHRYAVTGTDADYRRMVGLLERQLVNWRVTGVPGYMFRAPFAMLDEDIPVPPGHPELNLHTHKERTNHVIYELSGDALQHLPDYYSGGVEVDGTAYQTTATAEGSPSLDAYSGAFLGQTYAWDLLRPEDGALRDEIRDNVVCHLHRYRKVHVSNLQQSEAIAELLAVFVGSGAYTTTPGELDLTTQDDLWGYALQAIPPDGVVDDDFRRDCPDDLPWQVDAAWEFDASDEVEFVFQMIDLANRMGGGGDHPVDYIYFTNMRAADSLYLLHLCLQAWHMTGDARYLEFVERELIGEQRLLEVLPTLGAFKMPDFCDSWIGSDLIHPVVLAIMDRLASWDSPAARAIEAAMREDYRYGILSNSGQSWFQLTYSHYADRDLDATLTGDLDAALDDIAGYVPEPDHPFDPKRAINRDYLANPEEWVEPRYPTQAEIDLCSADIEVFGITIEGEPLDPDTAINATPVPAGKRLKESQIWHFPPFRLSRDFGHRHRRNHEYFVDYTTSFWVGREAGHWAESAGYALAWGGSGEACSD